MENKSDKHEDDENIIKYVFLTQDQYDSLHKSEENNKEEDSN